MGEGGMSQTILVVEDDADLREALTDTLDLAGYRVIATESGEAALVQLNDEPVDLLVSDVHMGGMDGHALLRSVKSRQPDLPVLLMTAYGTIQKAVEAMREGAADYLVKPFEADELVRTVSRHVGQPAASPGDEVAFDPKSVQLFAMAERVARSDATIFITGESGTGKEVLARFIHHHSSRAARPFVAINCAAIPENMLEATLFGYEKGAFTGAYRTTPGKFEQAQGGTLLLDEVSEMDLALQAKLLRVLQEREVERIGGRELIRLDVRILATSNRNLRAEVEAGRFREDLYYRLNVFPLNLPPLRERPGDIVPIAERLLARHAREQHRPVPLLEEAARRRLLTHDWPGNVRELDNLVQRALILQVGEEISADDLHFEAGVTPFCPQPFLPDTPQSQAVTTGEGLSDELRQQEFRMLAEALRKGTRKAAAERLGISERTLRYKIARMREAGMAV